MVRSWVYQSSIANLASSVVTGVPSDHMMPSRSVTVHVVPSSLTLQDSRKYSVRLSPSRLKRQGPQPLTLLALQ